MKEGASGWDKSREDKSPASGYSKAHVIGKFHRKPVLQGSVLKDAELTNLDTKLTYFGPKNVCYNII